MELIPKKITNYVGRGAGEEKIMLKLAGGGGGSEKRQKIDYITSRSPLISFFTLNTCIFSHQLSLHIYVFWY